MPNEVLVRRLALGFMVTACLAGPTHAQTTSTPRSQWTSQDVGRSTPTGEFHFDNGQFTISAGGGQMQGPADEFRFVYQILSGDVKISARLDSLAPALLWSNAGLMIRGSLQPDAAHGAVMVRGDAGPALQTRTQTGGLTTTRSSNLTSGGAPQWLGLERAGSRVTAYMSPDGNTWTAIGSESIELGADVYVGIAVTSSDAAQSAVAQLSQVSIGGLPAGMRHRHIGGPATRGTAWHSEGVYALTTGGVEIGDTRDRFHFAYRRMQGAVDVVARVASLTSGANAGVMIRESLAADSRHAAVLVSGNTGYAFDRRTEIGASSERTEGGPGPIPAWVKLVRRGTQVEVFRSSDGLTWTSVGTASIATSGEVYAGLAVSSETAGTSTPARTNRAPETPAEATAALDEVSITSATDLSGPPLPGLPTLPPVVTMTSPGNGATFTAPAAITMTALATDPELRMAQVEFYANGTLVGADSSSPYSFTWSSVPAGSYTLTAVATDADGGRTTSSAVSVTVQPGPNEAPSVTMTSPANGATFTAPATITLTASASDPENRLARVEFYANSALLGAASSSPYSFTWSSVPAGSYTLTAKAFDSDGGQTTSSAVTITVTTPSAPAPRLVAMTASTDHDNNVDSYLLEVFAGGADPETASPIASSDLGKPTPDANREISVDRSSFFAALPPGTTPRRSRRSGPEEPRGARRSRSHDSRGL